MGETELNRVLVYINGRDYKILSEESEEHILGISEKVNDLMKELKQQNANLNGEKAAVLTALNLCDDYYKAYNKAQAYKKQLGDITSDIKNAKDDVKKLSEERQNLTEKCQKLAAENKDLSEKLQNMTMGLQNVSNELTEKVQVLENE